jgi:hypothetical protein
MDIKLILIGTAILFIIFFLIGYFNRNIINESEGFQSTDSYWEPDEINDRSPNVSALVYFNKKLNNRKDFKAVPNSEHLLGSDEFLTSSTTPNITTTSVFGAANPYATDTSLLKDEKVELDLYNQQNYNTDINITTDINVPVVDKLRHSWMRKGNELNNRPEVNTLYGKQFYYDKRYPESAIPIEYAHDPVKFCQMYPSQYPCWVGSLHN